MGNSTSHQCENYKILGEQTLHRLRLLTGYKEEEIRNEHTKFFSVASNGRLKKSNMEQLLGDYLPQTKRRYAHYLSNCVFSAIDKNDDGYIDFGEYLMSTKFFKTTSPIEKADFVFRIIDKDGDHQVTKKELEHVLKCLREYHKSLTDTSAAQTVSDGSKSATEIIFDRLDTNRSGTISISEFVDGWLKNEDIRALFTF